MRFTFLHNKSAQQHIIYMTEAYSYYNHKTGYVRRGCKKWKKKSWVTQENKWKMMEKVTEIRIDDLTSRIKNKWVMIILCPTTSYLMMNVYMCDYDIIYSTNWLSWIKNQFLIRTHIFCFVVFFIRTLPATEKRV